MSGCKISGLETSDTRSLAGDIGEPGCEVILSSQPGLNSATPTSETTHLLHIQNHAGCDLLPALRSFRGQEQRPRSPRCLLRQSTHLYGGSERR